MAIIGYSRILIGLSVFESLGPIITTIAYMFNDVARFLVIWLIVIFSYASSTMMILNENPAFTKFEDSLLYWI